MKIIKELRNLSDEELRKRFSELRKELLKLNVGRATGGNVAPAGKIRQAKKQIARILTLIQQKGGAIK